MKTLFEKIISGELPTDKVYEDEKILVIKDKFPQAPIHFLLIPKKPIPNLNSMCEEDFSLVGEIFRIGQKLANAFEVDQEGYRIVVNNGRNAGQEIAHVHFHLIGGKRLGPIG
ncbi:MAG: histidine triad nucleotide-binding protein [Chlamydiales bacterium]